MKVRGETSEGDNLCRGKDLVDWETGAHIHPSALHGVNIQMTIVPKTTEFCQKLKFQ